MQLAVPGTNDQPNHLPLADDFPDVHCELLAKAQSRWFVPIGRARALA